MRLPTILVALALSALGPAGLAAHAQGRGEQGQVRKDMRDGDVQPLREIERRVIPTMPGMQYLGPEYEPVSKVYRLKFIDNGRVVFVDVDARTGRTLGHSR